MSELLLRKEIYQRKYIEQACAEYQSLADLEIRDFGSYYEVAFQNCIYPKKVTMDEFENYLIDLMVKKCFS